MLIRGATRVKADRHILLPAVFLLAMLPLSPCLTAATWENTFSAPLTYQYETNPTLSSTDEQSIQKSIFSPSYSVIAIQDLNQWTLDLSANIERSSNVNIRADRDDPNAELSWVRTFETGEMAITAHYDESSTLETGFEDNGQIFVDGSRTNSSLSAAWQSELSEKFTLSFSGDYTRSEYTDITLTDYIAKSLNSKLGYKLSDTSETFIQIGVSQIEPINNQAATDRTNFDVGLLWKSSDDLNFELLAGVNEIEEESGERTESHGTISMNYQTEITQSNILVARTYQPSGVSGGFTESNQLNGSFNYQLSEVSHFEASFSVRENLTDNSESRELLASYLRNLSDSWDLQIFKQFRQRESISDSADNSIIGLTLIYSMN